MSALSQSEQAALEAEQAKQSPAPSNETEAAELETGTTAIPRTLSNTDSPTDPRFDRDDLRQGKPPPAARNHHLHGVGKLPGHALRVPGKGLKIIKKTIVGKDGKKEEIEEEVPEDGETGEDGEHEHKGGLLSRVLHPHSHKS